MDFNLRRGLLISFIVGGVSAMIVGILSLTEATLFVGIAILTLAAIWWFLFLCSKSPVKRYCWAIPDKLMFTVPQESGYEPKVRGDLISVWIDLTPKSGIMVDRIAIKAGRKRIYSFEWKAHKVLAREHKFLDFRRPDWLKTGEHRAMLIAYTAEGYSKSEKFIIKVDS